MLFYFNTLSLFSKWIHNISQLQDNHLLTIQKNSSSSWILTMMTPRDLCLLELEGRSHSLPEMKNTINWRKAFCHSQKSYRRFSSPMSKMVILAMTKLRWIHFPRKHFNAEFAGKPSILKMQMSKCSKSVIIHSVQRVLSKLSRKWQKIKWLWHNWGVHTMAVAQDQPKKK